MHPPATNEHYLEAAIASAPPARLRLMLIERGLEIARWLSRETAERDAVAHAGQCLRLRDILGELLSGVAAGPLEVATKVSDLYVFLLQHLTRAEQDGDGAKFEQIAEVLEIERQTWAEVCAATVRGSAGGGTSHVSGAPLGATMPASGGGSSLNLQA